MNIKQKIAAGLACLSLYVLYDYKDHKYNNTPLTESYKIEFQKDTNEFSKTLENRIFPQNADAGKTIDINLLIDADLKRRYNNWLVPGGENDWQQELLSSLENASEPFNKEFGLSFRIAKLNYWDPMEQDLPNLLYELMGEKKETFASVCITGKDTPSPLVGLTLPPTIESLKTVTVITANRLELAKTLQHEMSHWFMAKDYEMEHASIMDYFFLYFTNKWDEDSKQLIRTSSDKIIRILSAQKNLKTKDDPQ